MALQRFPGLIDIHVHLRDPGFTAKEDFVSGSRAAIRGGFTFICDMPNNPGMPTVSIERLREKAELSQKKSVCDVGFHYGTDGKNTDTFQEAMKSPDVYGLKIYCSETTGELHITDSNVLERIFKSWKSTKPILVHADGSLLDMCIELAADTDQHLHICHVADTETLSVIRRAKENGNHISAGVTPHHLFLKQSDIENLGPFGMVKPPVGNEETRLALWEGVEDGTIDLVESDHAPHTKTEKMSGTSYFGVPGLETTFGLLVDAVVDGKLTLDKVLTLLYENPMHIFHIPMQRNTYIEFDPSKQYIAGENGYETKCGWSPFDGWELHGPVERVVLRGTVLVENGTIV